ncbi:MAG: hypothetical protein GY944_25940 [bacterium]|nr:hypothetical protein [bacterium]
MNSLLGNAPGILDYGLPGLAFLLAYFAFRLLQREQKNASPRPELLRASRAYFLICVLFATLLGGLRLAERAIPPAFDPLEMDRCRDSLQLLSERDERIRAFERETNDEAGWIQALGELHDAIRRHERDCGMLLRELDQLDT